MANSAYEKVKARRLTVLGKFGSKCAYCGCDLRINNFHIDHIKPKNRNKNGFSYYEPDGLDHIDNLHPSCSSCNSSKLNMSIEQFREHILNRLYRLNRDSTHYQIAKRFGLVIETDKEIIFHFETFPDNAE